jgi:formylglycine-generating enzyme required for sulfatase activity/mono/diheme cytochrome c family protein
MKQVGSRISWLLLYVLFAGIVGCDRPSTSDAPLIDNESTNGDPPADPARTEEFDSDLPAKTNETEKTEKPTQKDLPVAVREILSRKCAECHHGASARRPGAGKIQSKGVDVLDYVLELDRLASDYTSEKSPEDSDLWTLIESGEMPPKSSAAGPLTDAELDTIRQWIEAGCPSGDRRSNRPFIPVAGMLKTIAADLLVQEESRRTTTRYVTLTNLYNAGESDATLRLHREAVAKLINSLSWSEKIVRPVPVDDQQTVLRINMADLQWSEAVWDGIWQSSPYSVESSASAAQAINAMAGSRMPYVRADWFLFAASQPPLYHEILELPRTDTELEQKLKVNVAGNISRSEVVRAGVIDSGVSRNNRMLERHETSYGAYWKSYDFGGNIGSKDIRTNPLGPGDGDLMFIHDGGEIIFNLPNGMQGYLLTDDDGNRIDEAPIGIVQDSTRQEKQIRNGISCISCHAGGLRAAPDVIRAHVRQVGVGDSYSQSQFDRVMKLYPKRDDLNKLLDADTTRFLRSLKLAGVRETTQEEVETIVAATERYQRPITSIDDLAAEFQISAKELSLQLASSESLRQISSRLTGRGGIPREQFSELVGPAVSDLGLGKHVGSMSLKSYKNSIGIQFVLIPAGEFTMGEDKVVTDIGNLVAGPSVPRHRVKITQPFYMGIFEVTQEQYERIMGDNPSEFFSEGRLKEKVAGLDTSRFPVESVTFEQAKLFCKKLSGIPAEKNAGCQYRLPSEAQWEYACRAGTTTLRYCDNDDESLAETAWFTHNAGFRTHLVGALKPNPFGLFDMYGNVQEYCADKLRPYRDRVETDPFAKFGQGPVVRGGFFWAGASPARSGYRSVGKSGNDTGFRLIMTR